ncbi:MAG: 2-oxoacid:acceptor oxidoreductase subunit alpha [Chthonomonadales bacterium]|nr:2-oxoacid:acceptor oxidoreductase subunit alpha [Chthonomonadales bacterium]
MNQETSTSAAATDVVIRLVGESGEGTVTLGDVMVEMFTQMGLDIYTFQTFPAEIKGGTVMYQIRARSGTTLSPGDSVQILVALNKAGFSLFGTGLADGSILLYNSDVFSPPPDPNRVDISLPVTTLAREQKEAVRHEISGEALKRLPAPINTVGLGALMTLVNAPLEPAEAYLNKVFGRKGEAVVRMNISALRIGAEHVRAQIGEHRLPSVFPKPILAPRMMVTGNQMTSIGSLAAGLQFYAGYPITPATEIMEFLARELPAFGGTLVQAEDEIAALAMCIGAANAGAKAMTATSGPGLSLMAELLNLAGQAEIPVVVIDVQRGGASTGLPTKASQGDLNLAIYGMHNESPRIVIGSTSVEDAFWTAIEAMNLAEEYQVPVILLSDQSLATRRSTVPPPEISNISITNRLLPSEDELGPDYHRYRDTPNGISPMALPGMIGGMYTTTGIEHNEKGDPAYTPENATKMKAKRFRKMDAVIEKHGERLVRHWGVGGDADIGIIAYGSLEGIVREATQRALDDGINVAHLHLRLLQPFPTEVVQQFAARCRTLLVPEMTWSGQLANWILINTGLNVERLTKDDGIPFRPSQVYARIRSLYDQITGGASHE